MSSPAFIANKIIGTTALLDFDFKFLFTIFAFASDVNPLALACLVILDRH